MPLPNGHSCKGEQLFGAWAIEPHRFNEIVSVVNTMPVADVLRAAHPVAPERVSPTTEGRFRPTQKAHPDDPSAVKALARGDKEAQAAASPASAVSESGGYGAGGYEVVDGIAILEINGPMTKYASSFQGMFGGTATLEVRRQLRDARSNRAVTGILCLFDSPGGTVAGTHDLADDIYAAADAYESGALGSKPVWGYGEDLVASAALCCAVQCCMFFANRNAIVGSIGTMSRIVDSSKQAEKFGIKVYPLVTGFAKGAGMPGVEVTQEQIADGQRTVNELFQQFRADVIRGRGLTGEAVDAIATGQVWIGEEAKKLGLVDGVQSLDQTIAQLRAEARKAPASRTAHSARSLANPRTGDGPGAPSSKETQDMPAASIAELKKAFPNDATFALDCAEKDLGLVEAKAAYADHLAARLQNRDEELAKAKKDLEAARGEGGSGKSPAGKIGVRAAPDGAGATTASDTADESEESGDAVADFNAAVEKGVGRGLSRDKAVAHVAQSQPELHKRYLVATQTNPKSAKLVEEKFGS